MSAPVKVLLTGANGFIAVHILEVLLLARGYDVVGTVRSESKTTYLRKKFNNNEHLSFAVVEDITAPGAFDQVIKDTAFDAVLHTSSPFNLNITDIAKELYEPAINGTTELLASIRAHGPTVKRVVVTSSFAAIVDYFQGNRPGYAYSEGDWNPLTWDQGLTSTPMGYSASKTFAEQAAWDFTRKEKPAFTLTTLCPPMVYGPPEQEVTSLKHLNTSAAEMYAAFSGVPVPPNGIWLWVDARDVALAHVQAIEKPAAENQRYLISGGQYSAQQFLEVIWKYYPERAEAKGIAKPGQLFPDEGTYTSNTAKSVKDLGLQYRTFEEAVHDTLKRFVELEEQLAAN